MLNYLISSKFIKTLDIIGKGSYGSVYSINLNNKPQALKVISNNGEGIKSLIEIDIMSKIDHPNIVKSNGFIVDVNKKQTRIGIIMPLAIGDLKKLMSTDISYINRIKILFDISNGIKVLHDNNYIHLDLNPQNILIYKTNTNLTAKITDFGLSQILYKGKKYYPSELITITHRAPEILNKIYTYTKKSDIWSLGILFLEVLSGGKRIFSQYDKKFIQKVLNNNFTASTIDRTLGMYLEKNNKQFNEQIRLIKSMLNFDPKKRPTIDQILRSSLFDLFTCPKYLIPKYIKIEKPKSCGIIYYYGFDYLIRAAISNNIKTETFYLAADIYQRSLAFSIKKTEDFKKDLKNIVMISITSLFMAGKMLDFHDLDLSKIFNKFKKLINIYELIKTEKSIIKLLEGKIYYKNLFTETTGYNNLIRSFDFIRNCNIYHKLNLVLWKNQTKQNSKNQKKITDEFFKDFFPHTNYYKLASKYDQKTYLEKMYKLDTK